MLLQFTIHFTQECKVEKKKILMIALASYERYDTSILSCHNMAKSFMKLHFEILCKKFEKCHKKSNSVSSKAKSYRSTAGSYLQPHNGNEVFGNIYLSAGQH